MTYLFPQYSRSVSPEPVFWFGASGTRYEFELNPLGVAYHPRPGVYIFCRPLGQGQWDPIYIGETDNFARRIANELSAHHRWQCIRAAWATHICTLHVPNATERLRIEADLRHHLIPHCNRQ